MRIALDLDDTITDTDIFLMDKMVSFYHVNKKYLLENNYSYINMSDEFKKREIEFNQKMFEDNLSKIPLKKNAKEIINKLFENGNSIYVITSRQFFKNVYNSTLKQLNNYGIKITKLICSADKKNACVDNNIDVFIDDSVTKIKETYGYVKNVYVFESRYNKNKYNGLKKVKDWEEIYSLINKL